MTRLRLTVLVMASALAGSCGASVPTAESTRAQPSIASTPSATTSATAPTSPRPSTSPAPAPSVVVAQTDDLAAGLPYYCFSHAFEIGVFYGPPLDSQAEARSPSARDIINAKLFPDVDDWWLTYRSPTEAEFVGRAPRAWASVRMQPSGNSEIWFPSAYGGCEIRYAAEGIDATGWWIVADEWPSPADRELSIRARDVCPTSLESRLRDPIIRYGPEAILIVLLADPGTFNDDCRGTDQVAALTLRLDEPVGGRALIDGGVWPARDAHIKTPRLVLSGG